MGQNELYVPPDETPKVETDVVAAIAARYESGAVPADVRRATKDQEGRRAYANRRGGQAALRALVRVA